MDSKELRLFREAYGSIYEGYGKKKEGECVDKEDKGKHNCAKKVCHESFGEGTCIFGEHAVPDKNGFVSHYDVMFEHGIERNVPITEMEVLVLVEHPTSEGHEGMYDGEQIDEDSAPIPNIPSPVDRRKPSATYIPKNPVPPARDKRPQSGGKDMGRGTPNEYKKGKPTPGSAKGGVPASLSLHTMSFEPEGDQIAEGEIRQQQQLSDYKRRAQEAAAAAERAKDRESRGMKAGPNPKPRTQMNSVDLFDIVKGHLMSEGYADTEEAALAIMANMSEEWRQSIVEQNVITRTGTSTNAAGEKIKWTHNYDRSTGRSTVTDKFGTRDSTPVKRAPGPRLTRDGETRYIR